MTNAELLRQAQQQNPSLRSHLRSDGPLYKLLKALIGVVPPPPSTGAGIMFFGASTLDGHTDDQQILSPGWDLSSVTLTAASPGIRIAKPSTLSTSFFVSHVGDPANAGLTIEYGILLNGLLIVNTGALDASTDQSSHVTGAARALVPGDLVQVVGIPSAAFVALLTNVSASIQ